MTSIVMTQIQKADFILEIGVEEIPSALIKNIKDSISSGIKELLDSNKLIYEKLSSHGSPRRLYFEVINLDTASKDEELLLRGPASKIGVENESASELVFTAAALSFAKKNQISEKDLYVENGYIYAKSLKKGNDLKSILEANLAEIIKKTPGKRFMRWSNTENKFTRPIEWISSRLFFRDSQDIEEINFNFEDIQSSNLSFGHRIYGKKHFTIQDQKTYLLRLKEEHIILKEDERKAFIIQEANKLAKQVGGIAALDDALLEEICGLVESPKAVLCEFSKKYLEVPALILKTVMKVHQRYIPIMNATEHEELTPYFIVISNNPESLAEKNIKAGNEKVIIPRFEDACFFLNEDNKIPLQDRLCRLEKINFQVGNMKEKAERLQRMVEILITELESNQEEADKSFIKESEKAEILKAALLAKADLDTQLVFEFTELQGEIGGIYAKRQGLSDTIAKAISEQYMPRFADDSEPESLGGKLIALVDKLDNIIAYFSAGKIPKGSADPFALRRQANGLLQIIVHGQLKFNLENFIKSFLEINPVFLENSELSKDELLSKLTEFLEQRLEFVFAIHHTDSAINKAVLSSEKPLQNLYHSHKAIHFLNEFKKEPEYEPFLKAVLRVNSMAKSFKDINTAKLEVNSSLFKEEAETNLNKLLEILEPKLIKDFHSELKFSQSDLLNSVPSINEFFDKVLVNDTDTSIKSNRQNLIFRLNQVFNNIANFSELK